MATWLSDDDGNQCSVDHFGSMKAARKALDSLVDCSNCSNCVDCNNCNLCTDCKGCGYCVDCTGCKDCGDCVDCTGCKDCGDCVDCANCTGCTNCRDCSYCTGCTNCRDCSSCSYCRNCNGCAERRFKCHDAEGKITPKTEEMTTEQKFPEKAKEEITTERRFYVCATGFDKSSYKPTLTCFTVVEYNVTERTLNKWVTELKTQNKDWVKVIITFWKELDN